MIFKGKTQQEIDIETTEQEASRVRADQKARLLESDWTMTPDAPTDKRVWAEYRQALRDITIQPGFPLDIEWPVSPAT